MALISGGLEISFSVYVVKMRFTRLDMRARLAFMACGLSSVMPSRATVHILSAKLAISPSTMSAASTSPSLRSELCIFEINQFLKTPP
jgi:hypothetical protein